MRKSFSVGCVSLIYVEVTNKFTVKSATFAIMAITERLRQIQNYLLCILVFCIPFSFSLISISIILLAVAWLFSGNINETWQNLKSRKVLWPFIIFYLLHAISYFYSTDKANSLFDLEEKLSLVILPIIVGAGMSIKDEDAERVFFFFTSGVAAISTFCTGRALYVYFTEHISSQFFYHELVYAFDANAVYMAWYAIFSLLLLLFFPWSKIFKGRGKYLQFFYIAIQLCFFVLLSAKTLTALFVAITAIYALPRYFNFKKIGYREIALLAAGVGIFAVVALTDNPVKKRYMDVIHKDIQNMDSSNVLLKSSANLNLRLFLWRLGMENIREHKLWWYGAGNGDVSLLQNEKLAQHGIENIYNPENRSNLYNVNLHNMYLQTIVMLGIPGLILLLFIIATPFRLNRNKKYKPFFIMYGVIGAIFLFQEAGFQSAAGIVYYILFLQIFISINYSGRYLENP